MERYRDLLHAMFSMQVQGSPNDWKILSRWDRENPEAKIIDCSESAAKALGWVKAELIGQPLIIIIPPEYRQSHLYGLERTKKGETSRIEGKTLAVHALCKDGKRIRVWLNVLHFPVESKGMYSTGTMRRRPLVSPRKAAMIALLISLALLIAAYISNRTMIEENRNLMLNVYDQVTEVDQYIDGAIKHVENPTHADLRKSLVDMNRKLDYTLRLMRETLKINEP